ncbi:MULTISPECIES: hypothetical protein [unclassified Solwaraspora]|uniref:hypothetical protein n=1 Tax=unclassified Solwaraspora TaxID=2627926 RepID=UPI00248B94E4|nr:MULTISPECIES: hypothetical protein [unclassified Solwaraspora]WBB95644.1 hypothetical protein O7553_19980 [Solwaraspora sp. WMMA2059]WBC20452.1 hypothetical protein O7543_27395 [Solwaraspora sp. WMMA2080]WJK37395.1 hypothetical protein O7610_14190 [Solwaraspora sp. WMMA2065]
MAATALAAAEQQLSRPPGEATTAVLVARLAQQLLDLDRQIKDIDKLITSQFRAHIQIPSAVRSVAQRGMYPPWSIND